MGTAEAKIRILKIIYNKICTIARARMAAKINMVRRMKMQALKAYTGDYYGKMNTYEIYNKINNL